jgi:hypothetical protein
MTNPNDYEDEGRTHPVASVLKTTGTVLAGLAVVTLASTAVVAYVAAKAGQNTRAGLDAKLADTEAAIHRAGDQVAQTARRAVEAVAGAAETPGTPAPAV